ncbi:RUN domain-containing protein 1 [Anabrus simplex]|uniref:RUN domain-containing protein 1 n=1 Tax=Anabrus simplex TaxID=316456 RepID=UPI0034DCFA17
MMDDSQCSEELDGPDPTDGKPAGERWAPVGANDADDESPPYSKELGSRLPLSESERLQDLEEQQEMLNSSLIALTSHFAQVQFRLRQIVEAPPNEREQLLKDLEAFAFRGIPETRNPRHKPVFLPPCHMNSQDFEDKMVAQRLKQKELISQLKKQLEDLEKYAYETGEAGLPQSMIMERQRIIIDQLKGKLNLNVDDMSKLTVDDLRNQVDYAISQLVNPLKMKEHLVTQLKTQISDLERFIEFLQGDGTFDVPTTKRRECTIACPVHCAVQSTSALSSGLKSSIRNDDEIRAETINVMKKATTLLHMFAAMQFGCGAEHFRKNSLKKTMKANHWGDLRASLEMAVDRVKELVANPVKLMDSEYASDSDDGHILICNAQLTYAVRKQLASSIRDLMQHGLMPVGQSASVVPLIGCFPQMSHTNSNPMHAWELILKYYKMKNGEKYNSTPARKLSQSFNLDIVGAMAISNKHNMLSTIGNIITTHKQYKRSYDSQFKAFICAALNAQKLVVWLRLIFRCQKLVQLYYQSWSYLSRTGFEDTLQCLDQLTVHKFELPVDLAVRQFQNIKDAF